jgi:hypothetical protein
LLRKLTRTENYLRAIVKEDQQLVNVYDRLNTLVIQEIAATTTQIKDQVGRLTTRIESIQIQAQSISEQVRQLQSLQMSYLSNIPSISSRKSTYTDAASRREQSTPPQGVVESNHDHGGRFLRASKRVGSRNL